MVSGAITLLHLNAIMMCIVITVPYYLDLRSLMEEGLIPKAVF
jgi:hypothetical protein